MAHTLDNSPRHAPVAILLATYNGERWLTEQLHSIFQQHKISPHVIASDDFSTDGTRELLNNIGNSGSPISLLHPSSRCGSAGKNFYHLIAHADVGNAQYVAISDQDDVWDLEKINRAIQTLSANHCVGYSSDFYAWYPERGEETDKILIKKSQPQVAFDHFFQSPGPGCTFVLTRPYFDVLREFVRSHFTEVNQIFHHDWMIYAHARCTQHAWYIDPWPSMLYRQHATNETGVSKGWTAATKRVQKLRAGWLNREVLSIAQLLHTEQAWPVQCLQRLRWRDRWQLALHVGQLRRSHRDRLALALACLFLLPRHS
jgi:rhamnosyltransferase